MALSDYGCQLVWTRSFLNEVSFDVPTPYIYGNNLGLLFWGSNSIQEKCSKHIDICYYYIRDLIENEQVKPYYIDGKENPADILTKNLGQVLFSCFCTSLGLEILYVKIVDSGLHFLFSLFTLFYFSSFSFLFYFLFLEQLRLGLISHAVTSVTSWWYSHKTDYGTWENGVEGSGIKWHYTT